MSNVPTSTAPGPNGFVSNDRPGTPLEKLHCLLERHVVDGVGFDEATIRRVIGLPPVANPRNFPRSDNQAAADRSDERLYADEVARAVAAGKAAKGEEAFASVEVAALREQNAQLEEKLNAVLALLAAGESKEATKAAAAEILASVPATVVPAAASTERPSSGNSMSEEEIAASEGGPMLPDQGWPRDRSIRWLEAQGLGLPPKKGVGMTNMAVADFAIAAYMLAHPEFKPLEVPASTSGTEETA